MARPKSVVNTTPETVVEHQTQTPTLPAKAFSVYRDEVDKKWYVAVVPFNPKDTSVVAFEKAPNFFMPEQIAAADDKYEAFEHFRKIFGEYLFGEES